MHVNEIETLPALTRNIFNMHLHVFATSPAYNLRHLKLNEMLNPVHKIIKRIFCSSEFQDGDWFIQFRSSLLLLLLLLLWNGFDESSIEINIQFKWRMKYYAIVAKRTEFQKVHAIDMRFIFKIPNTMNGIHTYLYEVLLFKSRTKALCDWNWPLEPHSIHTTRWIRYRSIFDWW